MQGIYFLLYSLANPVAPTVGALSQTTGNIARYPFNIIAVKLSGLHLCQRAVFIEQGQHLKQRAEGLRNAEKMLWKAEVRVPT